MEYGEQEQWNKQNKLMEQVLRTSSQHVSRTANIRTTEQYEQQSERTAQRQQNNKNNKEQQSNGATEQ
jgi:hypothetical protein